MFKNFFKNEAGAVTIDWVALTAGILLLGIAVVYGIFSGGVSTLTDEINSELGTFDSTQNVTAPGQGSFDGSGS